MPDYFPEGNTGFAMDDEWRLLAKWCSVLISTKGDKPNFFPEGCNPHPGDTKLRLLQKILTLYAT